MSAVRPPHITEVMIAAADLENAEFERDRLATACGAAIRQALADGYTLPEVAHAANLPEADVRRLTEALPAVLGGTAGTAALPGYGDLGDVLVGLHPSVLDVQPSDADGTLREALVQDDSREPNAAL